MLPRTPVAPRFSIVCAVYNVADYLPDFIASVEAQTFDLGRLEVVMVDDGSTDGSLNLLHDWQRRRPELVTILTKPNGGQASARNLGMDIASGEWFTFVDPDDTIEAHYLENVDGFLAKHPDAVMAATRRILVFEADSQVAPHPLDQHFVRRNRLRNLDEHPSFFHGSAPASFVRKDIIDRTGLRFSEQVRPNFEDGHFCASYLLACDRPLVAFVRSAEYRYLKRASGTSTLGRSRTDPDRYTKVLQNGFLGVLRSALAARGFVPEWLQNMVLYELSWYFQDEDRGLDLETAAHGAIADAVHDALRQISELLDDQVIRSFSVRRFDAQWREILMYGYRDEPWHNDWVKVETLDLRQQAVRVVFRYTGTPPTEQWFSDGVEVQPVHAKHRAVRYFDRPLLNERIVWLPFGNIRVRLDGADVEVRLIERPKPVFALEGRTIRQRYHPEPAATPKDDKRKDRRTPAERAVMALAGSRVARRAFRNAWVLMDRISDADDSAEHLFRYLRRHKRNVNAWFVVDRNSADYRRLRRDRYVRVVPHGSLLWKVLMLNCTHLISSHVDQPIVRPSAIARLRKPEWRFTFLQHGVIKDDLSRWLNAKPIDVFVTSTRAEQESVAGDGTGYRFTTREAVMTGLPRFDALLAAGNDVAPEARTLVLFTPSWRNWLIRTDSVTRNRIIDPDAFRASEFAQQWRALISSPQLAQAAHARGLDIALLLHPNLQRAAPLLDLPPYVRLLSFESDPRMTFARSRVVVTDYSSTAFNAAYIERPVVYFQFDRDRVFSGGHVGRAGYFDYWRDGFGPVAETLDDAVAAVTESIEHGPHPAGIYVERIRTAFEQRDGRCCERVYEAIRASTRKAPRIRLERAPDEQEPVLSADVDSDADISADADAYAGVDSDSDSGTDYLSESGDLRVGADDLDAASDGEVNPVEVPRPAGVDDGVTTSTDDAA